MSAGSRRLAAGVAGAAGVVAVLTLASRLLGFGRWLAQAAGVGVNATGDAYATANALPNVLYEVVAGGALAGVVVPLLAVPLARRMKGDVDAVASALLTWAVVALVPIGLLLAVLARPIAGLLPLPRGADAAVQVDLVATFLVIFSPQVVLYGIGIVLTGVLQAHRRFVAPALAPLASSVVVIASYLAFGALAQNMQTEPERLPDAALAVLAWGTTAGVAALSLPLLIPVARTGVRLRPRLSFPPGVARRARSLALAGLGGVLAQQVAVLTAVLMARSGGVDGTINVFQYTQAVYLLPYAVLAVPLVTVFQPRLAELAGDGVGAAMARLAESSTRTVTAVGLLGAGVLVAAAPAAQVVFELRDPVPGMTEALTVMAPGVVGLGLVLHAGRTLLALDRSRATVTATALAWLVVAAISVVGVRLVAPDGGDGTATVVVLGAAHAVGMSIGGLAIVLALRGVMPAGFGAGVARTLGVGLLTALVGGLLGRLVVDAVLAAAGASVGVAVGAALLGALPVLAVTLLGARLLDRAILSTVRGAHV